MADIKKSNGIKVRWISKLRQTNRSFNSKQHNDSSSSNTFNKNLEEHKKKINNKFQRSIINKTYKFPRTIESDKGNVAINEKPIKVSIYDIVNIIKTNVALKKSANITPISNHTLHNQYVRALKKMDLRLPLHAGKALSSLNDEKVSDNSLLRTSYNCCARPVNSYENSTIMNSVFRTKRVFKNKARVISSLNHYNNTDTKHIRVDITLKHSRINSLLIRRLAIRQTIEKSCSPGRSIYFKTPLKLADCANSRLEHYIAREYNKPYSRYIRCKISS